MRYVFAGDREISVKVLAFLMKQGLNPLALMVTNPKNQSHANELKDLSQLPESNIWEGKDFTSDHSYKILNSINPDYIIGIHFPYIIPENILRLPKIGFLNLHPGYLPYNKGWHTPSWSILENTKIGGTLHFMAKKLDSGDIILQLETEKKINDTANTLYQRVLNTEFEVFKQALPYLTSLKPPRTKQINDDGTSHVKKELFDPRFQELQIDESIKVKDLIQKLRAHTTSNILESAFFIENSKKYRIQIHISECDE